MPTRSSMPTRSRRFTHAYFSAKAIGQTPAARGRSAASTRVVKHRGDRPTSFLKRQVFLNHVRPEQAQTGDKIRLDAGFWGFRDNHMTRTQALHRIGTSASVPALHFASACVESEENNYFSCGDEVPRPIARAGRCFKAEWIHRLSWLPHRLSRLLAVVDVWPVFDVVAEAQRL